MKVLATFLAFLASGVAFAQPARVDPEIRKAIELQYSRWSRAYVRNDVKTLLEILHPRFTLTPMSNKTLSRTEYEKILRRRPKGPMKGTYVAAIKSIAVEGGRATVTSEETTVESEGGKQARHVHVYRDVWVRGPSGWKLLSSKTLRH